jgi:hypothetical protein
MLNSTTAFTAPSPISTRNARPADRFNMFYATKDGCVIARTVLLHIRHYAGRGILA